MSPGTHRGIFTAGVVISHHLDELVGGRDPAEDAALGGDHGESRFLELVEVRPHAVGHHEALEAPVVGLPHGRVHADLGRDAGHDERGDALPGQQLAEVGGVEGALAGFVDDRLVSEGLEVVDDVVTVLTPDQDPALRAGIPDAHRRRAAVQLRGRAVGQVG